MRTELRIEQVFLYHLCAIVRLCSHERRNPLEPPGRGEKWSGLPRTVPDRLFQSRLQLPVLHPQFLLERFAETYRNPEPKPDNDISLSELRRVLRNRRAAR